MAAPQPSRRSLIGALALAPIAITAPAVATPAASTAWDKAVQAYNTAHAAQARFLSEVYDPAIERVNAVAPRPSPTFSITATNGQVASHRFDPQRPDEWDDHVGVQFRQAAAEQRRLWEAHRAAEAVENIDAIDDQFEALTEANSEAWNAVLLMPAPHLAAVAWKLDTLFGASKRAHQDSIDSWHARYTDAIIADVNRFLGKEATQAPFQTHYAAA